MPRYRMLIEYDGTAFSGWQSQAEGTGVQDYLQRAIQGFTGERIVLKGAGRTDAGVHALGQVCHFDIGKTLRTDTIRDAGNVHLRPHAITIVSAEEVPESFDARFSAVRRHYRYRVFARRAPPTLERHLVWHVHASLDVERMADAAKVLLGRHDFTTFRSSDCQSKSPVKTLDQLDVVAVDGEIHFLVSARSFLHNQVRSMVGGLRKVGDGRWTAADLKASLDATDRSACAPVAPPEGLCLMQVDY
ncbi:tRNA pseudouridine(38-40) synthase TruA [Pleomorphomonas sp. T1.2MG-36]|uniref:tRNA pseudouridine(38-40) synthase TruA n=1 Tax=Pleomorphomonas sp. T1.2MG-36 TaxID=3041167 RepID=UPI0025423C37|nr:tRNA pseudouridine(38-40) synthase TruA [Pleomorphomonas sp. T1.2MG-36]